MNYKNSTVLVLLLFLSHSFAAPTLLFKVQETPLAKKHTVWGRTGVNRVDQVLQRLQKNAVPLFTQADENLQRWYQIYFSSADSAEHTLEVLAGLPDLEYADLNRAFRLHDRPDDPRLDEQWALSRVQAFDAWDIEQGDAAIPIAIIDTGVDYKHKDLEANIWINPGEDLNGNGVFDLTDLNGIDDDGNGYIDDVMGWDFTDAPNYPDGGDYLERDHDPMDEHGHGTGVAGIVAAVSDNQIGISGLAPNCRIMNLRAFTANGYGEEDDVASAVLYAIENDARIINMSFGDVFVSRVLDDVIEYARKKDIIMVASAGNSSSDDVHYPSGFNATISVGSTDESDQLSGFSNYGSTIDLVAPGSDILSTDLNDGYRFWNGTSFSCPYVSAAAALLLSRNTALAAESIRGILVNSTDLIGGTDAWNPLFGSGRLNVLQALSKPVQSIVRITEPALDQGFATGPLMIRGSAWSPSFSEYSLYWGTGFNPDAWNPIIKGVTTPLIDSVLYVWDHLPKDGEYTLSLRVQNRDGAEERHQTRFFLDSTPPVISETALFPMIDGPNKSYLLEFYTDDLCEGTIHYREAGSHDAWNTQKLTFRTVESRFHLTPDLIDQNIEFYVTSHNSSGLQTADDNDGAYYQVDLSQPPLPDMAFAPIGLDIEPGRILSEYSDYNSNGLPELIVSSQSDGGIGPLVLYELQNNAMIPVYTSEQRLIPRDLKDINGDGRPELLSGFGFNSYLYTSPSEGAFPSRLLKAWEGNGADQYWASRLADLDKDGKGQVIMRVVSSSDDQDMFKVFELQPDDTFESVADLPNPTPGENFYGVPHCEISDFDGDGYTDILFGDSDGDIYIYENKGDDQYQAVWQDSLPLIDSIDYIDHGDFDGDGVSEFIAGCHSQPNLNTEHYYDARHWLYRVYDRQGDNDYKVRAEWRFFGFESPSDFQSGVSAGDVDGDGDDEIYLSLFPDFYVIDHVDDHYKIIHYQMPAQTGSVLTGDLNVDGIPEYWMSDGNRIRAFALTSELTAPVPPVGLTAAPLDERTVSLNWRPVNGADSYTIFRGPKADLLSERVTLKQTTFIDSTVQSDSVYYYAARTLDTDKEPDTSILSRTAAARPGKPPALQTIQPVNLTHIRLLFSKPMNERAKNVIHYNCNAPPKITSAVLDRSGRAVILTFDAELTADQTFSLFCSNLQDVYGIPLDSVRNSAEFTMASPAVTPYLKKGEWTDWNQAVLEFSTSMMKSSLVNSNNYMCDAGDITIAELTSQSKVALTVAFDEPPVKGQSIVFRTDNIENNLGIKVNPGRGDQLELSYQLNTVKPHDVIVYPNPLNAALYDNITFTNLKSSWTINILNEYGQLVRSLKSQPLLNRVAWDIRNQRGNKVAPGIYLYQIKAESTQYIGKLAIVR